MVLPLTVVPAANAVVSGRIVRRKDEIVQLAAEIGASHPFAFRRAQDKLYGLFNEFAPRGCLESAGLIDPSRKRPTSHLLHRACTFRPI